VISIDAAAGTGLVRADLERLAAWLACPSRQPSEYSLANLYLYRDRHAYRLVEDPIPHLLGMTYDGERHALPLAPLDDDGAVATLLDSVDCLYPLEETEAEALGRRLGIAIDWRDEDSDYLYDAPRLARLDGAKAKRAQARAFEEQAAPQLAALEEDAALAVLDGWLADVGRSAADTDFHECREAIALGKLFGLAGHMTIVAGDPVAFLLAGPAVNGTRIVHFAKGRRAFAGAYPWMFARFAAICGADRLNFEQDLGKPGFAQAKRALAPVARLRKYRVRRR
jgi:hypothetical protein